MRLPLLRTKKVLAIRKEHILNARLEDDRAHGALLTSAVPSPTTVGTRVRSVTEKSGNLFASRVCQEDMHTMFRILLVITLRLEHEPFEDIVVVCDNTAKTHDK
jgi:hypothetical protein